ncbi:unnamed protein product [Clavelina lepadiformis]|uniref:Inorganic phosphate cotransporter n=1 Tax=Clavelina lepadiformis TaxID=159417 RepID=A0ABP0F162_CLALP
MSKPLWVISQRAMEIAYHNSNKKSVHYNLHGFSCQISPWFSGILMGITNTWGNIPGLVSPLVVGAFTENNPSQHQWLYVFYIAAAIYVFGAIFYIVFASGMEQEWNRIPSEDEESNILKE